MTGYPTYDAVTYCEKMLPPEMQLQMLEMNLDHSKFIWSIVIVGIVAAFGLVGLISAYAEDKKEEPHEAC
jgi:hypothetical protein